MCTSPFSRRGAAAPGEGSYTISMTTGAMIASFTVPLTDADKTLLGRLASDLRFILNEYEVPERWQLHLQAKGYTTMITFGVLADDRAGLRLALVQDLCLDPAEANLSDADKSTVRSTSTKILASWLAASQRVAEDTRHGADQRMLRLPITINKTQLVALRQRFETENGRVTEAVWPCSSLIEKRLEEVEEGAFTAQPLTEVISVEQAVDEQVVVHEAGVNVKVRKTPKAIGNPTSTEELRNRMKTLAITFVLAAYRHGSRLWLRTATMQCFLNYTEYLLSDQVASFHMDEQGLSIKATWETVLSYDLAMRKAACRSVLYNGLDFDAALVLAMEDLTCRTRYFITPTALLSSSRSSGSGKGLPTPTGLGAADTPPISTKKRKQMERIQKLKDIRAAAKGAAPKGRGKGKGKGKNELRTPDGRLICKYFNTAEGCSRNGCTFVHICSVCHDAGHNALTHASA